MSKKEKLIARLIANPKDFTFEELVTLLGYLGYTQVSIEKMSGSRVAFSNSENEYLRLHKPRPGSILKTYQILDVISTLNERGLL